MFMMDEVVGHMTEKVVIPPADQIEVDRRAIHTHKSVEDYLPYGTNGDMVPEMAHAGEGYKFHVTGFTHDERGYPNMTPKMQQKLVTRLQDKILSATDRISMFEEDGPDADVVVVSYGITSRVAQRAIEMARADGLKVGKLRLITAWPFPENKIRQLAAHIKAFVVPELNLGQMVREVERAAAGKAKTFLVPHAGGSVHHPEDILAVYSGGCPMSTLVTPSRGIPSSRFCAPIACRTSGVRDAASAPPSIALPRL